MRASRSLIATQKETPADAEVISHQLMIRAGMIRKLAAGLYTWLPLGLKVLRKVEAVVRDEMNKAGAQEVSMPVVQPAELWQESGRWEQYGPELLRIKDRHDRDFCLGPTHEEVITDLIRSQIRSYRQLPANFYQIQTKFRDEIRPRFGIMRAREFLMKDAYSFDLDYEGAKIAYNRMFVAYLKTYARMGLRAIPLRADTGPIGGDLSHEFIILADTGESEVFYHKDILGLNTPKDRDYSPEELQTIVDEWTSLYAAADEMHDADNCPVSGEELVSRRGIEVGHIFHFGQKYSSAFDATVAGPDGKDVTVSMGSYGIGVSRLVGGIIEACHDDNGIVWPESVAPFKVGLINLKTGDDVCDAACDEFYTKLQARNVEVLYDDRKERAGGKFANMDLIGLPWQVTIGPRGLKSGVVEVKNRKTGEKEEMSPDEALNKMAG